MKKLLIRASPPSFDLQLNFLTVHLLFYHVYRKRSLRPHSTAVSIIFFAVDHSAVTDVFTADVSIVTVFFTENLTHC